MSGLCELYYSDYAIPHRLANDTGRLYRGAMSGLCELYYSDYAIPHRLANVVS